jgi:two-component system, cell cycle sensor histidine kinase and response regulator CckA
MVSRGGLEAEQTEELTSLRREVQVLRQRVAELQRRTARHRDEEEARDQNGVAVTVSAREELLVEAERIAHVGSWVWDVEGGNVFWSDEMFRILGYDPERDHATSEGFFERIHPDDRERVQHAAAAGTVSGVAEQVDYRIALPDGRIRYATMNGAMLFDDAGKLRRMVGTVRDLTEERVLQRRMQLSLELLEEAQSIAQMGSWTFDLTSRRTEWSVSLYRLLGVDPSIPAAPELFFSLLLPDERERVRALHTRSLQGDWTEELECRFARPNGEIWNARVRTVPVRDGGGRLVEFRGTVHDITEQTRLVQRLNQVSKTEAVTRLAGGIAHDFNNLLTVIGANLELWAEAAGKHVEIVDARRAVQSARSLTDRLLALGRRAPLAKRVVDPNDLVHRTVDLLRRVIGDRVRLVLALAERVPPVNVDPALLEQAIINLVINARDAMPHGGTVTLTTRASPEAVLSPWVELEVGDDGPGMDADVKSRIFEPFFTTKGERGTGLGLPTVLATIEQHGGTVEVDSERGKGARFRLRLAAELSAVPQSLVPETPRSEQGDIAREILVVEDEPLVAAVIARSLERKGHRPLLAHRPSEALRLWEAHPSVALVICDVSMAEMQGPELVALLRQSGREFQVIYVTGYQPEGLIDGSVLSGSGTRVLTKPFSPRDLIRAVSESAAEGLRGRGV